MRTMILGVLLAAALHTGAFASGGFPVRIDVLSQVDRGAATVSVPASSSGGIVEIFDDQPGTIWRGATPGDSVGVLIETTALQPFFGAVFKGGAQPEWFRIEIARTLADLQARSGSYRVWLDWTVLAAGQRWGHSQFSSSDIRLLRLSVRPVDGGHAPEIDTFNMYEPVNLTSVTMTPTSAIVHPGASVAFTYSGRTLAGKTIDLTPHVVWESSNPTAAPIVRGVVTTRAPGVAFITARGPFWPNHEFARATVGVFATFSDVDVTHIEQTPRLDFDAPQNLPRPGETVTYLAHVRCWNEPPARAPQYAWTVDGVARGSGVLNGLTPGQEVTVPFAWVWDGEPHTVRFSVDQAGLVPEMSEENNTVERHTDAVSVGVWAEQSLYDYFRVHQVELLLGSNSLEDFVRRQLTRMTLWGEPWTRFELDKVVVVPDGALPLAGGSATDSPDRRDRTVDVMAGMPATLIAKRYLDRTPRFFGPAFDIDYEFAAMLGRARYLIDADDLAVLSEQVRIIEGGLPLVETGLLPFGTRHGGITAGGWDWSDHETWALRRIAGRRALCGNYAPPCNTGEYLNDLPARNVFRVEGYWYCVGDVREVRLYRRERNSAGELVIDNTPDLVFQCEGEHEIELGRNPFSNGPVTVDNGVALLRLERRNGEVRYEYLDVPGFNLAYWGGADNVAYHGRPRSSGCVADMDDGSGTGTPDGGITIDDLLYFLQVFAEGNCRADFDDGSYTGTPDSGVTIDDFLYFLFRAFDGGC